MTKRNKPLTAAERSRRSRERNPKVLVQLRLDPNDPRDARILDALEAQWTGDGGVSIGEALNDPTLGGGAIRDGLERWLGIRRG